MLCIDLEKRLLSVTMLHGIHMHTIPRSQVISTVHAAGFTRLDVYDGHIRKWRHWGMCIHWRSKLAFPQMLYESENYWRWFSRGSDTSMHPCTWLESICVFCQALEALKNLVGRIRIRWWWKSENGVTATMTLFPHANSRLYLGTLSHLAPWNKPIHGL